MLEITRDVWEGSDYVPLVWNEWLRDRSGRVLVATVNGRMVGLQHAAIHPDNSVWLEGIRVASDVQGQGVGRALLHAGVAWAREIECEAVRLATTSTNPASNRIAELEGLRVVGRFRPLSAAATASAEPQDVRIAQPGELESVWRFVTQSADATFYTEGWTAFRLTTDRLRLLLAAHACVVTGPDAIDAVSIVTSTVGRPAPRLGLAVGDASGVERIARWIYAVTRRHDLRTVRATVQADDACLAALARAGFQPGEGWEHTMLLHEIRLSPTGSGASVSS